MAMVERVAAALAQSFKDTVARSSGDSWEATGVTLPAKEVWERYARAAIEAMREPTEEMVATANSAVRPDSDNLQCPDFYRAMINAALQATPSHSGAH